MSCSVSFGSIRPGQVKTKCLGGILKRSGGITGLDMCEGNCNSNADCRPGLRCFQRSGNTSFEPYLGCSGAPIQDYNYCVPINSDDYSIHIGDLVCADEQVSVHSFETNYPWSPLSEAGTEFVIPDARLSNSRGVVSIYAPKGSSKVEIRMQSPDVLDFAYCNPVKKIITRYTASASALKHCEGPCNSDADCYSGYACFTRSDYADVPGCSGRGMFGYGYCIKDDLGCLRFQDNKSSANLTFRMQQFEVMELSDSKWQANDQHRVKISYCDEYVRAQAHSLKTPKMSGILHQQLQTCLRVEVAN